MPLSIRRVERRRAPATDAAMAYAQVTNAASSSRFPSAGMVVSSRTSCRRCSEAGGVGRRVFDGSYFDGHFAITPFRSTWNPSGLSVPLSTTSAPSLKVSGTTPL